MRCYRDNTAIRNRSKTTPLTRREMQAVKRVLKALRNRWPQTQGILFGSKVNGTSDHESDIDLLILLPCPVTPAIRRSIVHTVFEINLKYDSNISVLIVSADEWDHSLFAVLPIHATVEQEGVPL